MCHLVSIFFFFFNDTATTEIYTLSLHDALPIYALFRRLVAMLARKGYPPGVAIRDVKDALAARDGELAAFAEIDRKSTRLNSSHSQISYAVFCLKKKKKKNIMLNW